jgi:nitronate monooxygenase
VTRQDPGDLLGVRYPIILAGMAGGPNTPELFGEVTRAGGLGVLGLRGMTADAARGATRAAIAQGGGGPVGVNVQLAPPTLATGDRDRIVALLAPFRAELGLTPEPPPRTSADAALDHIDAALEAGASLITTFEDPTPVIEMTARLGRRSSR